MNKTASRKAVSAGGMNTQTKAKRHWGNFSAIEKVATDPDDDKMASVNVCDNLERFERYGQFDYFLVNTNEFLPFAPRGSVLQIFGTDSLLKPNDVVLVAGNRRLELKEYRKAKGFQILGVVTEVKSWPGKTPVNFER